MQMTSLRERPRLPSYFPSILSTFPTHVSWEPDQSYHVKMAPVAVESPAVPEVIRSNTILFAPEVKLPVQ